MGWHDDYADRDAPQDEHGHIDRSAPDPADKPREWTAEQCMEAYWRALDLGAVPESATAWRTLMANAERHAGSRKHLFAPTVEDLF